MLKVLRVIALAVVLALSALHGCASVQTVTTAVIDCAGKTAQDAITNVVGTIELILVAASDGEWMGLLDKLAAQWGPEGVAFVSCAVAEVRQHYASTSTAPDAGTRPPVVISLKPGKPSLVISRADAWFKARMKPAPPDAAPALGAGKR